MGDIFKALNTAADLASFAGAGLKLHKSGIQSAATGIGAAHTAIQQHRYQDNLEKFKEKSNVLTNAQDQVRITPSPKTPQAQADLHKARAQEEQARLDRVKAATNLLSTAHQAQGIHVPKLAADLGSAANGLAASGASAAIGAAKLGVISLSKRAANVLPGVGVATSVVGTGLAVKGLVDNVKAYRSLSHQKNVINTAKNNARAASTDMQAALDNVAKHAGASLGRALKLGRWDLAASSMDILMGSVSTAASAMSATGIGAVVGVPLGIAAGVVGLASTATTKFGHWLQKSMLGRRVTNQSKAVDTPEKVRKELDKICQKNKGMSPEQARVQLAASNRTFAVMELAQKLQSPRGEADGQAAMNFLSKAGVPETHIQALIATVESKDAITPKHPAVMYLHKFFGFDQ